MTKEREDKGKQGLGALLQLAGEHKNKLILVAILAAISAAMSLVPYGIVYLITIELFESSVVDKGYVWKLGLIALIAVTLRFGLLGASLLISHICAFNLLYDIRKRLLRKLGKLPLGYFTNRNSGTIKKIMMEDVERIELFIAHHIPDLVAGISLPIMTIIFLFFMDWRIAIAAILPLPIAIFAQTKMYKDRTVKMEEYNDNLEKMNGTIVEYVRAMYVVKAFNQTVESFTRYKESIDKYKRLWVSWTKESAPYFSLFMVILGAGLLFILPIGGWLFIVGEVTVSVLVLFLILGIGFMAPLLQLLYFASMLAMNLEGVKRINSVLDEDEIESSNIDIGKTLRNHNVEFKEVSFSYDKNDVLKNVNFMAKEGELTAFVGPSGAGKTTAAQLIPRFWDVNQGDILIGGVNIKNIPVEELMSKVAFVFQDVFLMNDTVYENITMGNEGKSKEQVIDAAKAAQAHEFIVALPEGYQTVIGEGGSHLSGGERQRISIARAMLKDSPIIILDEATAFADPENEGKIQDALNELMMGKTVIVIAHRLSTITEADKIVVFEEGKIAGLGKHTELLKTNSLYNKMWESHTSARDWVFHEEVVKNV